MDNQDKQKNAEQPVKISYTIAPNTELRVRNLSPENLRKLHNIAKWLGVPAGTVIKINFNDILSKYPDHFQDAPPEKDKL